MQHNFQPAHWSTTHQHFTYNRKCFKNASKIKIIKKCHFFPNTDELECGPMPNLMGALPNIGGGGALCSRPQFGSRPILERRAVTLPRCQTR